MALRTLAFIPLAFCAAALHAQDYSWPREIPVKGPTASGTIVLYQPQAEKLEGNKLTARGAIALKVTGSGTTDPIFGAMWMTATVDVDRDSGMVWLHDLKVERVRWPDVKPEQQARFTEFVEKDFPTAGFRITIERFQASLASAEAERTHTEGLKADAPKLIFVEQLAVLLLYDGEPKLQAIPNSGLQVVVNTPFAVVRDTASKIYWLGAGENLWYSAGDPMGPWTAGGTPPAELLKKTQGDAPVAAGDVPTTRPDTLFGPIVEAPVATPAELAAAAKAADTLFAPDPTAAPTRPDSGTARIDTAAARTDTTGRRADSAAALVRPDTSKAAAVTPTAAKATTDSVQPLKIIAATGPTELIVTQGPPVWKTTAGGKLLYVENTETPWLRETEGKDNYILVAGRWFTSQSTAGPWRFQRPDSLPKSFQDIPAESPIGGVRSSIAMTDEAMDALLDLEIPQTTVVNRNATLAVKYDGAPKFQEIQGTKVSYATNTGSKVLLVSGAYYACDNGVWFKSFSAQGPWSVADSIPTAEIAKIPPSSPVYGLTYVNVYGSTKEVVYVGYTPGYTGTYPYYGVPVYGTGWYYPPYIGTVYYPHPVTYGVAVSYNPYAGYGMGTTYASGFFMFSVGVAIGRSSHYGYYPPGGYRGCFNCTINVDRGSRPQGGRGGAGGRNQVNIGNSAAGGSRARPSNRPTAAQRPSNSNLYNRPENKARTADRGTRQRASSQMGANRKAPGSNNVFADRNGNVSRRGSNGWESRQGNSWQNKGSGNRASNRGMEREWQSRQRGASRSYGGGGGRGGGGRGGGGGRRR